MRAARVGSIVTGAVAGLAGVVGFQAWRARRVERIEPFERGALDGPSGQGSGVRLRVVWLGDSTGDGVGASAPEATFPRRVAAGLGRPVGLTVVATSGARARDVLREQIPTLSGLAPDWVVVGIGGNDVTKLTSRARFRRELRAILDGVAATRPSRIVVVGIGEFEATPLLPQPLRSAVAFRSRRLNAVGRDLACRAGALHVDVAARTGAAFAADPAGTHAGDGFHPSDAGYELWARAVLDAIREAGWLER